MSEKAILNYISPDNIERNPDNPRIFFRPDELDSLLSSINKYGIQVPINVYREKSHYVLIDGERRWLCAAKLNLDKIPALVQDKPTKLANLLLMFNIHALREQWDFYTIANKLPSVVDLFKKEHGYDPGEQELAEATGLSRGQVRRCLRLLELPPKYQAILAKELEKPKKLQTFSEDFFIEMERALKTVETRLPELIRPDEKNSVRNTLMDKYKSKVIQNVNDFRKLSKIATSVVKLGIEAKTARAAINKIFDPKSEVGIVDVFSEQFENPWDVRRVTVFAQSLNIFLEKASSENSGANLERELLRELKRLRRNIDLVLGR